MAPAPRDPASRQPDDWPSRNLADLVEKILAVALTGVLLGVFVLTAHYKGEVSLLKAGLLLFLGILTLLFGFLFMRAMQHGDVPQVESHWGGFGAGLGGWRMSQSLAYLLVTVSFATILVVTAGRDSAPATDRKADAATGAGKDAATKEPKTDASGEPKRSEAASKGSGDDEKKSSDTSQGTEAPPPEQKSNE
jgi:hypothetical protein